jgi:hypothetical protein
MNIPFESIWYIPMFVSFIPILSIYYPLIIHLSMYPWLSFLLPVQPVTRMGGLGETIYEQLSKLAQAGPETHGFRRGFHYTYGRWTVSTGLFIS